ncbi:MAG: GerW family sporulation protein, partial [Anaeromassilibacillus sp.]|nr:GerW family sporulation protein [Anaeromassilibacillus sp.]
MEEHPINKLMDTTMQKIKEMVDVNTIIGDPITTPDGTTIIPISKVSYGFAAGGTDFPSKRENRDNFGGGSGAGVSITPIGFLTVCKGDVRM